MRFSGGLSFWISGRPSQQWTGTRSGVPRWKAIRVRSAVFTAALLLLSGVEAGSSSDTLAHPIEPYGAQSSTNMRHCRLPTMRSEWLVD